MAETHTFAAEVWIWNVKPTGAWFFLTVPGDVSDDLRFEGGAPRGFGSVRVEVAIGGSAWQTSVFPSSDHAGCFILPLKKLVRTAERIEEGDVVKARVRAIDA